jgi:dihydroorotate dehydrogenase electron transfer subunit
LNNLFKGTVIKNQALTEGIYLISLKIPQSIDAKPGQFFMLRLNERLDPFLGRPFSIFDLQGDRISFLYRVRGKGTKILSNLYESEEIQITGPFGKWYPFPKDDYTVIAGGIGLASVFFLMKKFPQRAYLFYGTREKREILFYDELRKITKSIFISTECGSIEYRGIVTDVFKEKGLDLNLPIYACGPIGMIKELRNLLKNKKALPCYVAVEERMACGFGVCLGCVIETNNGFKRVCTEGPVFRIDELKL